MPERDAFIGLGSNLGDRAARLRDGLEALQEAGLEPLALSSVWETEPVDTSAPQWFLNMVFKARTDLAPREVLRLLMDVERAAGRRRAEPNGPRTLDLDLLLLGDLVVEEPGLSLPHPRIWSRRFVLEPLAEIETDLRNPQTGRTVVEECRALRQRSRLRKLGRLAWGERLLV